MARYTSELAEKFREMCARARAGGVRRRTVTRIPELCGNRQSRAFRRRAPVGTETARGNRSFTFPLILRPVGETIAEIGGRSVRDPLRSRGIQLNSGDR